MTMKKLNIKNIIKEEIQGFNFLNMDELKEEEEYSSLVNSKDFQTNLINDLAQFDETKIQDWEIDSVNTNMEDNDREDNYVNFDYSASFDYVYGDRKVPLYITIEGSNIPIKQSGGYSPATYLNPAEYPSIEGFDFKYSDVSLFTRDGDEINIDWLNQNNTLKEKLVNKLVKDSIM